MLVNDTFVYILIEPCLGWKCQQECCRNPSMYHWLPLSEHLYLCMSCCHKSIHWYLCKNPNILPALSKLLYLSPCFYLLSCINTFRARMVSVIQTPAPSTAAGGAKDPKNWKYVLNYFKAVADSITTAINTIKYNYKPRTITFLKAKEKHKPEQCQASSQLPLTGNWNWTLLNSWSFQPAWHKHGFGQICSLCHIPPSNWSSWSSQYPGKSAFI